MINKRGTTILVATHNQFIVNSMAKRVINLSAGKLVSDTNPQEPLEKIEA